MATRSGWERLSASYRSRVIGAGRSGKLAGSPLTPIETQRYWEAGGSMRAGRSHRYGARRPTYAAPRKATELEQESMGNPESYSELMKWRRRRPSRGGPPSWIPRDENEMRTDVAAILSQIDTPPERWRLVEFAWLAPAGPIAMRVVTKRGAERVVILPDSNAVAEVGRWLHGAVPEGQLEVRTVDSPGAVAKRARAA